MVLLGCTLAIIYSDRAESQLFDSIPGSSLDLQKSLGPSSASFTVAETANPVGCWHFGADLQRAYLIVISVA